jgi:hypothetical protein
MLAREHARIAEPLASERDRLGGRDAVRAQLGGELAQMILDLVEIAAGELGLG